MTRIPPGIDTALFQKIKGHLGNRYNPSYDELICLYCETHTFYKRLQRELAHESLTVRRDRDGKVNYIKNPLAIELTKTVQILNTLLRSLGLTATAAQQQQRERNSARATGGASVVEDLSFENF